MGRRKGSITVFLSLTGILIVALLGTLLETARYTVCANHAARTLRTSAEALLTEYSRPLYDNYGLFFIESAGKPYESVIAGYAGDTFEAAGKENMDFMKGEIQKIQVTKKTYLGDQKAEPLQKEINQYMLRKVTKAQLEKWVKKSGDITKTEKQAEEIEETVKEEKEAAQLDKELLELMKLVDGISVSGGRVFCEDEFIKMFAVGEKKGQNFGVTESAVWEKMKPHLDSTPREWEKMNQSRFLKRVSNVRRLTEKAIVLAEKLRSGYRNYAGKNNEFADHDKRMGQLVESLSALSVNKRILEETEEILEQKPAEESRDRLKTLWKDYDTESIVFDYTGVEEKGGGVNPLDVLSASWGDGVLNLVCENPKNISDAVVKRPDCFARLYEEQEETEDYGNRISDLTRDDTVSLSGAAGAISGYAMDEFCLDSYIQDRFGSYIEKIPGWKKSL